MDIRARLRRLVARLLLPAILAGCTAMPFVVDGPHAPRSDLASVTGPYRLALVLGSGGPRGFAQLGVLKVLDEAGIRPDLIVGSSAGALLGALAAAGLPAAEIERRALALSTADLFDLDLASGMVDGAALQRFVDRAVGGRSLEQLGTALVVVATRAGSGTPVAFTHGEVGIAVRASSAVPGSFRAVRIRGVVYVDGDVASPLPVRLARELGARRVVAVDVAQDVARAPPPAAAPSDWTRQAVERRVLIERERPSADLVIAPPLPYLTGFSVDYRRMAIAAGEAAAREALPRLRALALDAP